MPPRTPALAIEFDKKNPRVMRQISISSDQALEVGEVLLHIERFAFTANNVTYAMFGV